MKKDAYYFPHYCNARSDRKIKRLIKDLGIEGYGIYFMALEVLREQTDFRYPLSDIDLLADEFGTSEAKLSAVVNMYKLFDIDSQENFFSPKLILFLQPYLEKSDRARIAARKRWDLIKNNDANAYANALPEHCESESKCNANQNASKVNKVNKIKNIYNNNVYLTKEQYEKLVERFGKKDADYKIEGLSLYLNSKGDRYKCHYSTILTWARKEEKQSPKKKIETNKDFDEDGNYIGWK